MADSVVLAVLDAEDPVRVGRYELLGVLGSGVMGRVFLGRSPGGRLVAVKVIHRGLAADHGFRARFRREVSAARRVSGMFTVMVVDADVEAPQPWLATTYVAGLSLNQAIMDYGPMPVASVMTLTIGLAEGLGAVHAARVVHGDLKPANVLLTPDGPQITDFGISRALADAALTDLGIAFGTPSFMSPEQGAGAAAGPSSDIFSLGSVLVYATTGRTPFGAGQASEIFYRILYDAPDVSGVPAQIRPLIARCLAKDPALRPSTDQIMAEASAPSPEAGPSPTYFGKVLPQYDLSALRGRGLASLAAPTQPIRAKIMPEASNIAGHAFIAYVRRIHVQVDWLQQSLEGAGIPVWRDTVDLRPGEDWRREDPSCDHGQRSSVHRLFLPGRRFPS